MTAKIRAHNACVSLSICFPTLESWLDLGMRSGVSGVQLSLSCKGPATAWPKLMASWIFFLVNKIQRPIVHCCSRNCFTFLSLSYTMSRPIEQALSNLIPRHPGALPPELIDLARSLLAQSRMKASTLKAEEEIGRTYACANIACERLIPPLDCISHVKLAIGSRPPSISHQWSHVRLSHLEYMLSYTSTSIAYSLPIQDENPEMLTMKSTRTQIRQPILDSKTQPRNRPLVHFLKDTLRQKQLQ